MKKLAKRLLVILLVVCMMTGVLTIVAACSKTQESPYVYHSYATALGTNWNPHSWETNADDSILSQTTIGFVDSIYDGEGVYKWQYEMATDIKDITANATAEDKTKWEIEDGQTGRMWQIKLNPKAKWDNGDPIKADEYIWSMQQQLNPELLNYRANSYYSNDTAIYGAFGYYNQGISWVASSDLHETTSSELETKLVWKLNPTGTQDRKDTVTSYLRSRNEGATAALTHELSGGEFLVAFGNAVGVPVSVTAEQINALEGKTVAEIKANATLKATFDSIIAWWDEGDDGVLAFTIEQVENPAVNFDKVGLYKVDDYTIVYVTEEPVSEFNFLISCASASWLVHKATYEASIKTVSGKKVATYGTSVDNYRSYGPYKLTSYQADKQLVYEQNEQWYGWEEDRGDYDELVSHITLSDGSVHRQFQTTKIIVDVMTDAAAKQAFLKGDLDDYALTADDIDDYKMSDRLYQVDDTYTMRFFFNTKATATLDAGNNNKNSQVLKIDDFRHAFSLAINRAEFTRQATAAYKPAFGLLNTLYYYDVEHDPESVYRTSEWGKKAMVELYDTPYGAGQTYATLDEAYAAVTGYDLAKAKQLMKSACDQAVSEFGYTKGDPINIQVAYSAGELSSEAQLQQNKMNEYLNAAAAGSGFGTITLTYVGNLSERYKDVQQGKYAIGWGAWGGAAFYPFKMFECYLEPDQMAASGGIHEIGCFDPKTETLTIEAFDWVDSNGTTQHFPTTTKTWEQWSLSNKTTGTGEFVKADINLKLALLSKIEVGYIEKYYCIPVASITSVGLDGYKINNITDVYNIMYGFGGLRFMTYNFTESEWADWVEDNAVNGVLPY